MFGDEWMDNFTVSIELYETICSMHGVKDDQDYRVCLPAMLKGSALNYYNNNWKDISSYIECVQWLFQVYTSDEQRNRRLQEWHGTNLSSLMALSPEKLLIEVFKTACARLSIIQRQLHPEYHREIF